MRILGHNLPDRMKWLISNDRWKVDDPTLLAELARFSPRELGLELLCPNGMKSQTRAMRRQSFSSTAKYYGVNSPWRIWRRNIDSEILDAFSCLLLVVTKGENFVVLDYRTETPCVRASIETDSGWLRYPIVADSFDLFADKLGMPRPEHA